MPDAVLSPRQRHTWRERANGKICIEMLAERTARDWFLPSLRERRPDSATGGNPSRDLASMSRIRQKLDIQYEAQAGDFKLAAGERGILQESKLERRGSPVAESPPLCMRCGPLALLVIQIGEGISSGAILAHGAIGDSESVCPIHRAISILFEDDAVLFETRTTTAALSVRPSVRCFKRTGAALCGVTVFVAHAASAAPPPTGGGAGPDPFYDRRASSRAPHPRRRCARHRCGAGRGRAPVRRIRPLT